MMFDLTREKSVWHRATEIVPHKQTANLGHQMEGMERPSKRNAAKAAEIGIREELAREEEKLKAKKQKKQKVEEAVEEEGSEGDEVERTPEESAAARTVMILGGLFKCETATEDSQIVLNDTTDVKSICVNVEFLKEFGPFKPGDLANAGEFPIGADPIAG